MKNESRVINAAKNVGFGTVLEVFSLLLSFVTRKIFLQLLGNDYLSVNGLFTNILTILSFTELGIGSAIIYSLYKPLAEDDKEKIRKLLRLFKDSYTVISLAIGVLGIALIPFLRHIISDVPQVQEDIRVLYILFLGNTILSYVFGYKKSLLTADQKNYIVISIYQLVHIFQLVAQIVVLYITHDYILYLCLMMGCTLLNNIISSCYVNRKYPWIKGSVKEERLSKKERKPLFDNIKNIFVYKIGSVILNGTDNIIISSVINTALVGFSSNYIMIINAVSAVVNQGCSGLNASIGNYNVKADKKENERVFNQLNLISYWMFGMVSVMLACFLSSFIEICWLGKDYVLSKGIVLTLVASFYFSSINSIPSSYRIAMGFFRQSRYAPLLAAIINIILSVILAKFMGLSGIFLATSIAKISTYCIIDPYNVYKRGFNKSPKTYYLKFVLRFILLVAIYIIIEWVLSFVNIAGLLGLIVKVPIALLIYNLILFVVYMRDRAFLDLVERFKGRLKIGGKNKN